MRTAKITNVLDTQSLSLRHAQEFSGIAAAEFSRVRQAKFECFKLGRLIVTLVKLNVDAEVSIDVHSRRHLAMASANKCLPRLREAHSALIA